ncbi:MAG: tetratricopeptide repeat protein [Candidatus Kapaibacterium sp.]
MKIQKEIKDKQGIIQSYNNIGITYDYLGNNKEAIEYYESSIRLSKEIGYKQGIASGYLNIALIQYDLGEMEKSLINVTKALEIAKQGRDKFNLANAYANVGYVRAGMKNYDEALENYNQALKLYIELNDMKGIANVMFTLGDLRKDQGDMEQALWYFGESLKSYEKMEQSYDIAACFMSIGRCHLGLNQITKAINNCEKAYTTSNRIGAIEIEKDACDCLYEAYKKGGNEKKALSYLAISEALEDSISNKETSEKLAQLEQERKMLADSLSKETQKTEKEVEESKSTQYLLLFGSGLLMLLIVCGYFIKKMNSNKLVAKNN